MQNHHLAKHFIKPCLYTWKTLPSKYRNAFCKGVFCKGFHYFTSTTIDEHNN